MKKDPFIHFFISSYPCRVGWRLLPISRGHWVIGYTHEWLYIMWCLHDESKHCTYSCNFVNGNIVTHIQTDCEHYSTVHCYLHDLLFLWWAKENNQRQGEKWLSLHWIGCFFWFGRNRFCINGIVLWPGSCFKRKENKDWEIIAASILFYFFCTGTIWQAMQYNSL